MENLNFNVNGIGFEMLPVDGGMFMMGATVEQRIEAWDNERPAHQVTISPYYMGVTEVTQALWNAVMGEADGTGGDLPQTGKSWIEWQVFIARLNAVTGQRFRMPTEAEWEHAARGGQRSRGCKFSGSHNLDEVGWFDVNSGGRIHPVHEKMPNELGLYDMTGNVFEWCYDWYADYGEDPETDPIGPYYGTQRVYRGGAFSFYQRGCRLSCRFGIEPEGKDYNKIGLRLAMSQGDGDPYRYELPLELQPRWESQDHGNVTPQTPAYGNDGPLPVNPPVTQGKTKKVWPWALGSSGLLAVVALVLFLTLREKEELPTPTIDTLFNTEVVEEPEQTSDQEIMQVLDDMLQEAQSVFEYNQLSTYPDEYDQMMIEMLSGGWNTLLKAEKRCQDLSDTYVAWQYQSRIDDLKNIYLNHIGFIYESDQYNLSSASSEETRQQYRKRIGWLEQFSGIEEII